MPQITLQQDNQRLKVFLSGDFMHFSATDDLYRALENPDIHTITVIGEDIGFWDSSLLLIVFELSRFTSQKGLVLKTENLPIGLTKMLELALTVPQKQAEISPAPEDFLTRFGTRILVLSKAFRRGLDFTLSNLSALWRFMIGQTVTRRVDFLFALQECGPEAIGIVSLISFMVGLILAFVGAIQLRTFGAQIYVASLVTIGMIRIMGAIMCGIIMAGRTGASFAANLGTMQVNEEIDALRTMGIPIGEFLVVPRLAALVIAMPILTMLSDFAGMLGGGFVGVLLLDIPAPEYWKYAWQAWSVGNFFVGMFHGFIFGFIIALCGCYYGIQSGRNADGVGSATTKAVVSAIVWMILATGLITFVFERLGI